MCACPHDPVILFCYYLYYNVAYKMVSGRGQVLRYIYIGGTWHVACNFQPLFGGVIFLARGCNISDIMMQAKTCNYPVDIVLIPIKSLQTLSRVWSAGSKCSNVLYTHVAIGNHKETTTRLRLFFSSHNANPRHRDKTKHMSIRRKTQLRFRRLTISKR